MAVAVPWLVPLPLPWLGPVADAAGGAVTAAPAAAAARPARKRTVLTWSHPPASRWSNTSSASNVA